MKTPCLYVCMWDSTTLLFLLLSYTWRLLLLLPPSPSLSSFSILPVLMDWYSPSWSTKLKPVHSRVPVKPDFPTTSTKRNAKKSGIKIKALGASFIWIFHTPVCSSFIFEYLCPTFYALGKVERNNFFCLGKSGKEEAINNKLFKAIAEHYRSNDKKSHSFNSKVPKQEKWRIQKTGCLELRCSSDSPQPSPPITSNHLRGEEECSEMGPSCWWCPMVLCLRRHSQPPASFCPSFLFPLMSNRAWRLVEPGHGSPVWHQFGPGQMGENKEQNWAPLSLCTQFV